MDTLPVEDITPRLGQTSPAEEAVLYLHQAKETESLMSALEAVQKAISLIDQYAVPEAHALALADTMSNLAVDHIQRTINRRLSTVFPLRINKYNKDNALHANQSEAVVSGEERKALSKLFEGACAYYVKAAWWMQQSQQKDGAKDEDVKQDEGSSTVTAGGIYFKCAWTYKRWALWEIDERETRLAEKQRLEVEDREVRGKIIAEIRESMSGDGDLQSERGKAKEKEKEANEREKKEKLLNNLKISQEMGKRNGEDSGLAGSEKGRYSSFLCYEPSNPLSDNSDTPAGDNSPTPAPNNNVKPLLQRAYSWKRGEWVEAEGDEDKIIALFQEADKNFVKAIHADSPLLPPAVPFLPSVFTEYPVDLANSTLWHEWGSNILVRAKWEHEILGYSENFMDKMSTDYLDVIQGELTNIFGLYKRAVSLFFHFVQKLSDAAFYDALSEDKKKTVDNTISSALTMWGESIDGMLQLKAQYCGVDSDETEEFQAHTLTDIFITVYSTRLMYRGDLSLGPLIALALSRNEVAKVAAFEVLQHLSIHATGELREEAKRRAETIEKVRAAELEHFSNCIIQGIADLPPEVKKVLTRSNIRIEEIVKNFDVFRNCLLFETKHRLPHPLYSVNSAPSFTHFSDGIQKRIRAKKMREEYTKSNMRTSRQDIFDTLVIRTDPKEQFQEWIEIGHGAFGEVYTARSIQTEKRVAIKVTRCDTAKKDHIFESMKKEILILSSCHHPNIVNYVSSFYFDNMLWVVMEYCDGGTLRNFCNKTSPKENEIAYLCREILKGLDYLHARDEIHKDIKGDNILLHLTGEVKLADLGLCGGARSKARHTIAGSRSFMAPEMIKRNGYNQKLDIWSFGCVIMEMIEGDPPYRLEHPLRTLFKIATEGAPPLKKPERWGSLLKAFLNCCLQIEPVHRPTAKQLLKHPFIQTAVEKEDVAKLFRIVFLDEALGQSGLL